MAAAAAAAAAVLARVVRVGEHRPWPGCELRRTELQVAACAEIECWYLSPLAASRRSDAFKEASFRPRSDRGMAGPQI